MLFRSAIAYQWGWVAITIQWGIAVAGVLMALFVASRWHKTRAITAAQYVGERFSKSTQRFYTLLFLALSALTAGTMLYPASRILEVLVGIPLERSIALLALFCIVCATTGGFLGIIVTDVVQFVVLTAAVIILVPLSIDYITVQGGLSQLFDLGLFQLTNGEYTWGFVVAFAIYNLFSLSGNWSFIQRYTSVRSPIDARKWGLLFCSLSLCAPILWTFPAALKCVASGRSCR